MRLSWPQLVEKSPVRILKRRNNPRPSPVCAPHCSASDVTFSEAVEDRVVEAAVWMRGSGYIVCKLLLKLLGYFNIFMVPNNFVFVEKLCIIIIGRYPEREGKINI